MSKRYSPHVDQAGHLMRCSVSVVILLCSGRLHASEGTDLLAQSGVQGGLVVHLGCGDATLTEQLRAGDQYLVHGLDTRPRLILAARERLQAAGVYGELSIDFWTGTHLPYGDNLVNLLVVEDAKAVTDKELLRILAPSGVLMRRTASGWEKTVKPWPSEMDQWTHYFHGADGNPVANDTVVGPPTQLRWIGSPGWARHHDHMASMTALVSAGGRLFYILDEGPRESIQLPSSWKLIARDAFNGTVLWKRDITQWNTRQYPLKSGPAHLLRRLVAVEDDVYVTLDINGPVLQLDAATGETERTFGGSEHAGEIVVADGVLFTVADNSPSNLPNWRRVSTYTWKNTRTANPDWGWHGASRKLMAHDIASGEQLWQIDAPIAPCSLAVNSRHAVVYDGEKLVCFDRKTGQKIWEGEPSPASLPVQTNTGPRIVLYGEVVLLAANSGKINAWSAKDGTKLWEQAHKPSGHLSLKDLMVVDGLVWTGAIAGSGDSGIFTGYDVVTGEAKREFPPDVHVHWFHHRCYPTKATSNFLLTARNGTEYLDLEKETWAPNHWVRGGCIYGVMPCNGLTYASMDACGCQLEAKVPGFKALASGPVPHLGENGLGLEPRLVKGPAYGKVDGPRAGASDWPTFRHDAARSGSSSTTISNDLGKAWQAELGGRLSQPIVAAGKVFVAAVDAHAVHALDCVSGERAWTFTAGGRIDSPPTYYRGLILFGSSDGYIYALRGADGAFVWRFRGAPVDRRMIAWEQLESAWPVHGSVLVHDDVLYCTAGRNMFLDGGIHFLRLDPMNGQLLGQVEWNEIDPISGEEMHRAYLKKTSGNNMPVALSDVLSCDGKNIWMRSQKIGFDGTRSEIGLVNVNEQPADDAHLFCQVGFLDDSYFFRTYWTYGRRVSGGYGAWLKAGRLVPSGRLLCFDDDAVFGFGRKPEFMTNASVLQYQIFAANKAVTKEAIEGLGRANRRINSRSSEKNANSSDWLLRRFFPTEDLTAVDFQWRLEQPSLTARAMALSQDKAFVAGPPNFIDERQAYRMPNHPEVLAALHKQVEAINGKHGGVLWALNKRNGQVLGRSRLDAVPVFDGLAAAGGKLYMSSIDGRLICYADSSTPLPHSDDLPERVIWEEQPEDPSYLLPPEVPKDDDFDRVIRGRVIESELGYRLITRQEGQTSFALKKLAKPLTGTVTLKTRLSAPLDSGYLRNGYLVFGDGFVDEKLIKCGAKLKIYGAQLIQGPLAGGSTKRGTINMEDGQPIDLVVTVDLDAQTVTLDAGGTIIETALERPIKAINYVGFAGDNAVADFAPLEIQAD